MDIGNNSIPYVDPFRQLLQSVGSDIKNEDLAAIKFLCESHIPKGRLERVLQPLELFSVLIEHNLISNDQREFLVSIFDQIGRQDLCNRILEKEGLNGRTRSNTVGNGEVNRSVDTKESEVDRNAVTKEADGEVNRDAKTKEQEEVDREKMTKESGLNGRTRSNTVGNGEVNRSADTKENEVDRNAVTKEADGEVNRDAATKEQEEVDRERMTKESDNLEEQAEQPAKIVFAYSTTSADLLLGLPKETLRRNLTEGVFFGRGKGIESRGVFLNDDTASRSHFELEAIRGDNSQIDFIVRVLGKPIQVNNKAVKKDQWIKLNNNDELKVGKSNFKVQITPGNVSDKYELKFAKLSELQTTVNGPFHGSVQAAPMNYYGYNPVQPQLPGYFAPLPNLVPSQGPQVFQQQAQGLFQAGAVGPNGLYPFVPPGYVPTVAPPHTVHMFPMQGQMLPQEGPKHFFGETAPPDKPVLKQPDDKQGNLTAKEKRDVYQAQKKLPSEHAEDNQEPLETVTRSIEDTHLPKCEE